MTVYRYSRTAGSLLNTSRNGRWASRSGSRQRWPDSCGTNRGNEKNDMSPGVVTKDTARWETPEANQLDDALWRAWVAKGRERERRTNATFFNSIRWISIAALAVGAGLGSRLMPYDVIVRFVVSAAAVLLTLRFLGTRSYATAALFGLLALLFNPVAAVFNCSGGWQRGLMVASAVPLAVSFAFRNRKGVLHA